MRWITFLGLFLVVGSLQAAQVTGVTTSASGTNDAGVSISITVTFDGNVSATAGTTKLLLSVGRPSGDDAYAYANSDQIGTPSIVLTYIVRAGDNSSRLDYANANSVTGVTGMVGNLPAPGTANSLGSNANVIIDTAPLVRSVSTTLGAGTYGIGQVIPLTVQFSEPVILAGTTPSAQITLQLNASTTLATYVSGSGTSQLQFAYTVGSGDTVTRLDYASTTALTLTAGTTLKDAGVKTATTTLPAGGSSSLRTLNVDATPPTVTAITSIATNGSYKTGDSISITVQFSESVSVTGSPRLNLNTTPASTATFSTGSGTANLTFIYIVGSSDVSADLDVTSMTISPGTITDSVGNPAATSIPSGSATGSLATNKNLAIALLPSVASVTGSPSPSTLMQGNTATITVTLDNSTTISGTGAKLTLKTGAVDQQVNLTSNTSNTLVFIYTVQPGDVNPLLNYTSTNALNLGNVVINGFSGLNLSLPALTSSNSLKGSNIKVDTTTPGAPILTITPQAIPANGSSATVPVTITANEDVTGFTDASSDLTVSANTTVTLAGTTPKAYTATLTPIGDIYTASLQPNALQLSLKTRIGSVTLNANDPILVNGNIAVVAATAMVSTSASTVTLKAALPLGIAANSPVYLPAGIAMTVAIPAGAAQDLAGNDNLLTTAKTFVYDPMAPIGSILIPSTSVSPYVFTVQFSEPVTAPLAAGFTVIGGTVGIPVAAPGNVWRIPVNPSIPGGEVSLALNANAVVDNALNYNAASAATTFAPIVITKIESVPTTPLLKGPGQTVTLVATLSRAATLTLGSPLPTLALQTGTTPALAQLITAAGATSTLTFTYTVGSSDTSSDLEVVDADALLMSGGAIDGLTTMKVPAPGTTGSLSVTSAVTIDSTKPGITTFGVPAINGPLMALMAVTFNEPIAASGTGTLEATDFIVPAGVMVSTPVLAPDGRNATVEFTLPATSVLASYIVSLKTGAVADLAGNVSTETPSATIVYDPVTPELTLSATPGDKATAPLSVNISASKYVTGMATDDCNVTNGVASSISAAVGTSFTVGLTPTASLKLGQAAAVGVTTIRLQAVGGDVMVPAGTVLRLIDTGVSSVVRLSTTNNTTVTSSGMDVEIDTILPAAFPSGSDVWQANGSLVTMSVRANACTDSIGQNNITPAAPTMVRYDPTPPMFRVAFAGYTYDGYIIFKVTSSERVRGFADTGIVVTNCEVSGINPSEPADQWTVYVLPTASTSLTVGVKSAAATDDAGNASIVEPPIPFTIVPRVIGMSCNNADGTYSPGMRLVVKVVFTENVTVTGFPHLTLNLTPTGRDAIYKSGSGTKELLFDYTIVEGDATNDLDYLTDRALTLPDGATMLDADLHAASLGLGAPGNPTSLSANSAIVVSDGGTSGAGKPGISDQPPGSGGCGSGSGIALMLAGGWLGLGLGLSLRRRRATKEPRRAA